MTSHLAEECVLCTNVTHAPQDELNTISLKQFLNELTIYAKSADHTAPVKPPKPTTSCQSATAAPTTKPTAAPSALPATNNSPPFRYATA